MKILIKILSVLLGIDSESAKKLAEELFPKVAPVIRFVSRLLVSITFIYCLYSEPAAAILIGILVYFITELEGRVAVLEKELEVERRINREAYSTERYASYPGYPKQNKGNTGTVKLPE